MESTMELFPTGTLPQTLTFETFFDDITNQTALAEARRRRLSRGTNNQRGQAMRIVKPISTSNSPRGMSGGRRTTMSNEPAPARRPQPADQSNTHLSSGRRSGRPMSWHPGSLQQPQVYIQQSPQHNVYPISTPPIYNDHLEAYYMQPHFSPTMSTYSTNTSPCSAFSGLPPSWQVPAPTTLYALPVSNSDVKPYHGNSEQQNSAPAGRRPTGPFPSFGTGENVQTCHQSTNWGSLITKGFHSTSPPTPEAVPQTQTVHTFMTGESDSSTQVLDEPEEEGEVLVGMGLYDTPDKSEDDPGLHSYRSTVTSLLGSTFKTPESTGKGLMLEETWEPPASQDEAEDDDQDESEGGECEDDPSW